MGLAAHKLHDHFAVIATRISVQHHVAHGFLQSEVNRHIQVLRDTQCIDPLRERRNLLDVVAHDDGRRLITNTEHRQVIALLRSIYKALHVRIHLLDHFARTAIHEGNDLIQHLLLAVLFMLTVLRFGQAVGIEE